MVKIGCYDIPEHLYDKFIEEHSKSMFTDKKLRERGIDVIDADDRMGATFIRDSGSRFNRFLGRTRIPYITRGIDEIVTHLLYSGRKVKYSGNPEVLKAANSFFEYRDGFKNLRTYANPSIPEIATWFQNKYANNMNALYNQQFKRWKDIEGNVKWHNKGIASDVKDASFFWADIDPDISFKEAIYDQVYNPKDLPDDHPIVTFIEGFDHLNKTILKEAVDNNVLSKNMYDDIMAKGEIYIPRTWDAETNKAMWLELGFKNDFTEFDNMVRTALETKQGGTLVDSFKQRLDKAGVKGDTDKMAKRLAEKMVTDYRQRLTNPMFEYAKNTASYKVQYNNEGLLDDILHTIKENRQALGLGDIPEEVFDDIMSGFYKNPNDPDLRPKYFKQSKVDATKSTKDAIGTSYFKSRLDLDMNTPLMRDGVQVTNQNGKPITLKDFYEKDVSGLLGFYYDDLSSRMALGMHGIDTIYRGTSFQAYRQHLETLGAEKEEIDTITKAYDIVTGNVGGDGEESINWQNTRAVIRTWTHGTILGNTGMTALADIGLLVTRMGIMRTAKLIVKNVLIPRLSKMNPSDFNRLMAEIIEMTGEGNSMDSSNLTRGLSNPHDVPLGVGNNQRTQTKAAAMSNMIHRLSGLNTVTQVLRRASMEGFVDILYKEGERGFSALMKNKLKMSDDDIAGILEQINTHATFTDNWLGLGKPKITALNINKWNPDMQFKFGIAIRNFVYDTVFEPSLTGQPKWSHTPTGRFLWGILRFVFGTGEQYTAYARGIYRGATTQQGFNEALQGMFPMALGGRRSAFWQGVHGILVIGTFVSGLVHFAKSWLASQGRDNKDEYFEKRFGAESFGDALDDLLDGDVKAIGSVYVRSLGLNSAAGSVAWFLEKFMRPEMIDTMTTFPILAAPTTALKSGVTIIKKALDEDSEMTYNNWRNALRIIPYNNTAYLDGTMNKFAQWLTDTYDW